MKTQQALLQTRCTGITMLLFLFLTAAPLRAQTTNYVDADAPAGGDGTSWTTAYTNLQDALTNAVSGDQIWVAEGIYYPTDIPSNRTATFQLVTGVAIYGGFDPEGGIVDLSDERILPGGAGDGSILSGDIDRNDDAEIITDPESQIQGNNSYHVVTGSGTGETALLDGFTITAGLANGSLPNTTGGGMLNDEGSPTLTNVTFAGNSANGSGGGMNNSFNSSPTLTNVTFSGNSGGGGGGMNNTGSSPTLTNVTFAGNSADGSGGGMLNGSGSPTLTNVIFSGNSADGSGGGMGNFGSSPTLTNVTFAGNSASGNGGGMYNFQNNAPTLTNTIFWGNQNGSIVNEGGGNSLTISYSLVEGQDLTGTGEGNLDGTDLANNPLFMEQPDPAEAPTTAGDLRLQPGSPAINAGDPATDPLLFPTDENGNPVDLAGEPRFFPDETAIDMGAYEFQGEPAGTISPDDNNILYVDINVDTMAPGYTGAGDSWANALPELRDALAWAANEWDGTDPPLQIWVAGGRYLPTGDGSDRTATFQLISGVAIYGGFDPEGGIVDLGDERILPGGAGGGSILSGDIDGNDDAEIITDPESQIQGNNSFHVVTGSGTDATARLDGFTLTAGLANGSSPNDRGGGMINNSGSPTLTNLTFAGNSASDGGGMYNVSSNPTLTGVTFSGNSASFVTGDSGGGMYNAGSSPTLTNVTFAGNSAGFSGGGMHNQISSSPTLTNVTFSGNSAENLGGGMANVSNSNPTLTNVIIWNNQASSVTTSASASIFNDLSNPSISYSLIANSGGSGSWNPNIGTNDGNNIDADPLFVDADGPDGVPGTSDDDLTLTAASPALNAGDNSALPSDANDLDGDSNISEPIPFDLAGNDRIFNNGTVDMGAYEFQGEPAGTISPDANNILYVDINVDTMAPGYTGAGDSWANALPELRDALAWAANEWDGSDPPLQIWVAEGFYLPTGDGSDRTATFQLLSGVAIYGGFDPQGGIVDLGDERPLPGGAGGGSILSGDINRDDIPAGNSYTVVTGSNTDATALLDGFTITAGLANGITPNNSGGGMFNDGGSPTLANLTFSGNSAGDEGGGMYNFDNSNPTLTGVTFAGNSAGGGGGGMANTGGSPTLTNVTFSGNRTDGSGGGMYNQTSSPTLTNVTFSGNSAGGGGMVNTGSSSPTLTNVTFSGNSGGNGGGMWNTGSSSPTLANVIIWGNQSGGNPTTASASISNDASSNPSISYSLIANSGGSGSWNPNIGTNDGNNIDADPLFVDADGTDGVPGTPDDNLSLQPGSPALNAGDPATDPLIFPMDENGDPVDLAGEPRFFPDETAIDMGAYEFQGEPDLNEVPAFTSSPVTEAREDEPYSYQITTEDPDGDPLTITAVQAPDWANLTDNGDGTATLEGTPGFDDSGEFSVELEVSDGELSATQSFTITVANTNRPPVFDSDPLTAAKEGEAYSYTVEASDPDGDELSFSVVEVPDWASLQDNGDETATLSGTPGPEDMGDAAVELEVSDGTATATQSFTITVDNTNRAPSFDSSPVTKVQENNLYSYDIAASDPDGDALTLTAPTTPSWAAFADNGDGTATLEGTPGPDEMGDYPVELVVSDGDQSDTQQFTITVADTNRAPGFTSEPVTQARENQPYAYQITAHDPDGDSLSFTAGQTPDWANLTATSDSTATLEGTPGATDSGEFPVVLEVSDGALTDTQEFTITVADSNRAPAFTSGPVTQAREEQPYSYQITAHDPDGDSLSFTASQTPDWATLIATSDTSATLEGTPGFEDMGEAPVTLEVSDGALTDTQEFTITVADTNRAPAFTSEPITDAREDQPYAYQITAHDPDGDSLSFTASQTPEWASLTATSDTTATLEGTPGATDSGEFPVVLEVSDGALTDTQEFTITIADSNRAPAFTSGPITQAREEQPYAYQITAHDPDGDSLSFTAGQTPDWANLTATSDSTATLEGTPGFGDSGEFQVTLEVSDGAAAATQQFTITVSNTNRPPEILSQPVLTIPSQLTYRYVVAAVDTSGGQSDPLTFKASLASGDPLPGWLSWQDVPNDGATQKKALTGTPSAIGTYPLVITVADDGDPPLAATQEYTLMVSQGNRQPVIISEPIQLARMEQAYSYTVEVEDPDADSVSFSAKLAGDKELPDWLTFEQSNDTTAVFTGEPAEEDIGTYDIEVLAVDNGTPQKQSTQQFTLEVKYKVVEKLNALYNYPNPFNNTTKIKFELPEEGEVYIQLYNTVGGLIRETAPQVFEPGANEFELRARNLASGIYIYRIVSEEEAVTGRMTLIR